MDIWLDTADRDEIRVHRSQVSGLTTNPSLMIAAGYTHYRAACQAILAYGLPTSLETLSLDPDECYDQAIELAGMSSLVIVKIPATPELVPVVTALAEQEIPINLTAVCSLVQAAMFSPYLPADAIVSVFAGRIADTGRHPDVLVRTIADRHRTLWASTRELLNVIQARDAGCEIITLSPALVAKLDMLDADLDEVARMTVAQFTGDGERMEW